MLPSVVIEQGCKKNAASDAEKGTMDNIFKRIVIFSLQGSFLGELCEEQDFFIYMSINDMVEY